MPDELEFDHDVFISYSSCDKQWVHNELLTRIEKAGLRAFIDYRDFTPGAPSIKEMERGVVKCRKTLLVLTPSYISSEWCELESIMLQTINPGNGSLRLVPLLKEKCERPLRISVLTHIDFTDAADVEFAWRQLLGSLEAPLQLDSGDAIPAEIQTHLDKAKKLTEAEEYPEALPVLENALIVADSSNHAVAQVKTRLSLAHALYHAREDFANAERHYRDALALTPTNNPDLRYDVLHGLGDMLLCSGRLDEAKATVHEASNIAKRTSKRDILAVSLLSQGLVEKELGFYDPAMVHIEEAIHTLLQRALSLSIDDRKENANMLAACYLNKAVLCRDSGDVDEALALCGKAEEQHSLSGNKLEAAKALVFRGELYCDNAEWQRAFNDFQIALKSFQEVGNPLWMARACGHMSSLYATHERWEEALQAMFAAADGAKESGHSGEQVHFLCLSATLVRKYKTEMGRKDVFSQVMKYMKEFPEDKQAEVASVLSTQMDEAHTAIEKAVREDEQARDLLNQAKAIAQQEHLHVHLANCLLDEAQEMLPADDTEARINLIAQALECLKKELQDAQSPKSRGHLMKRIASLYLERGNLLEASSWRKKAEEVFEKSGDVFGLANVYVLLAEMDRAQGRSPDEVIRSLRKALSVIEGRSFHRLAAGIRIELSEELQRGGNRDDAQDLLNEAEVICKRHHFKDLISVIARNRSSIEKELQVGQAPAHNLPELLESLEQLLRYQPDHAVAYLHFWYFAWNAELLALVRSGPQIAFMVVSDDVDRFMKCADDFRSVAGYFLLATSHAFTVKSEAGALPIPPTWLFPATFPFLFVKNKETEVGKQNDERQEVNHDILPAIRLEGPANLPPAYLMVDVKSDVEGEGHMMSLYPACLPQEAIDLMIHRPVQELIQRRTVWFPTERFSSKNPLLTDLQIGHKYGVFPVYLDHLPTSKAVVVRGRIRFSIPKKVLIGEQPSVAAKWGRAILKLTILPKDEAQAALLEIPEVFADIENNDGCEQMEICLFEFTFLGERILHPAILLR